MAQIKGPTSATSSEQLQTRRSSDQKTTEHPQLGQTKMIAHDEKEISSTDSHKGNQPPKSILKRSARVVNQTDIPVVFRDATRRQVSEAP